MSAFLISFCGGVVGGVIISIYHIRRYNEMVDEFQREMMAMIRSHDQIVTGLIERMNDEEARRDH
jgi:uncharacterized membrane protein (DUF106 family)